MGSVKPLYMKDNGDAREAVGVFHSVSSFDAAIEELYGSGFDRMDISLLASENAVEQKLGHRYERVEELEDDLSVPRGVYVERESMVEAKTMAVGGLVYIGAMAAVGSMVASGGTLAIALVAAALGAGAGGLVGSALAGWLGHHHSHYLESQLAKGGLLLWVNLRDSDHEVKAVEILKKHAADDVHVHTVPRKGAPEENPFAGLTVDPFLPGARV